MPAAPSAWVGRVSGRGSQHTLLWSFRHRLFRNSLMAAAGLAVSAQPCSVQKLNSSLVPHSGCVLPRHGRCNAGGKRRDPGTVLLTMGKFSISFSKLTNRILYVRPGWKFPHIYR